MTMPMARSDDLGTHADSLVSYQDCHVFKIERRMELLSRSDGSGKKTHRFSYQDYHLPQWLEVMVLVRETDFVFLYQDCYFYI